MPDAATAPDATPWTRREIGQQPETLRATQAMLDARAPEIESFLMPLLVRRDLRIVLTGAGTSAFIGESLAPWLSARLGRAVEAVATTDIVSAPQLRLRDVPTLLVSFGRSGSSPESVAAVEIADARLTEVHHLVVTCNADGALARRAGKRTLVVVLPEATHDRGFAMTSSFSAMMYAALAMLDGIAAAGTRIDAVAAMVADMLERSEPVARRLAARGFRRVVYLGSGVFTGLAREAALKLLELSDGALVTAFDSAMGFRHGPKTIVDGDPLTRRYDLDILDELRADRRGGEVLAIAAGAGAGDGIAVTGGEGANDAELLFPYIVPAQLIGLHVSEALGLTPDRPNASGTVHRVVQGVRIHDLAA